MDLKNSGLLLLMILCLNILSATELPEQTQTPKAGILTQKDPVYTKKMAENNLSGMVSFDLLVHPDSTFEVINEKYDQVNLLEKAREALYESKFIPAMENGKPVKSEITVTFTFPPASYSPPEKTPEIINADSLRYHIDQFIEKRKKQRESEFFLHRFYDYDTHLYGIDPEIPYIKQEGFILKSSPYWTDFIYQNYIPLYHIEKNGNVLNLDNDKYEEQPLLTRSEMGIGSYDIKYAILEVDKSNPLTIPHTNLHLGMTAMDGLLNTNPQRSSNTYAKLQWDKNKWLISASALNLNQEHKSSRLNNIDYFVFDDISVTDHYLENAIHVKYDFLSLNYMNRRYSISTPTNVHTQNNEHYYSGGIKAKWQNHQFDMYLQHCLNKAVFSDTTFKKNETGLNFSYNFAYKNLSLKERGILRSKDDYYLLIEPSYLMWNHLKATLSYSLQDSANVPYNAVYSSYVPHNAKFGLGIVFTDNELMVFFGQKHVDQTDFSLVNKTIHEDFNYCEITGQLSYAYEKYILSLMTNTVINNSEKLIYYPNIESKNKLWITKKLDYGNALRAGTVLFYHSTVLDGKIEFDQSIIVDTFLGVDITNLFEFNVVFKNMLNAEYVNGRALQPYYIGANLTWNFIN